MERAYDIEDLKRLMERLRDPAHGCPWDLKQTYQSIAPFTLEECLELIDALEQSDYEHVEEELGDLLFQVIFYAQLGKEEGRFDFDSVVSGITTKLLGSCAQRPPTPATDPMNRAPHSHLSHHG